MSLDAAKVINVTPRYARLRAGANGSAKGQIIGWENIELISDRPFETMLKEFKQLKEEYPDRILIASIMEEYDRAAWEELIDRVEQTGIVSLLPISESFYLDLLTCPQFSQFICVGSGPKLYAGPSHEIFAFIFHFRMHLR